MPVSIARAVPLLVAALAVLLALVAVVARGGPATGSAERAPASVQSSSAQTPTQFAQDLPGSAYATVLSLDGTYGQGLLDLPARSRVLLHATLWVEPSGSQRLGCRFTNGAADRTIGEAVLQTLRPGDAWDTMSLTAAQVMRAGPKELQVQCFGGARVTGAAMTVLGDPL